MMHAFKQLISSCIECINYSVLIDDLYNTCMSSPIALAIDYRIVL